MSTFLELKNLSIGYKKTLVSEINTEASLGEIILLMGNNGVGKTTLIKTLLKQNQILNGEVLISQKSLKTISQKDIAEDIAIVFSKAEIPTNYTVEELINFGKYIHYPYYFKIDEKDKAEISEIISKLNLEQYRHTQLQHLSDGNLQKAFIGRALAQNSPIIILDEPTTHLDEDNKLIILNLLRSLAKTQNKLILFSSHDWRLAREFADKIWWIRDQKLNSGITEEILLEHKNFLDPHIFDINSNFVSPKIFAPQLEKELLFSFLQKNFNEDLSLFSITYNDNLWTISENSSTSYHKNLSEIKNSLQTRLKSTF
ncbi:iron complex transport system ATP-binding protein [Soonwooa buanensis]|uniref:Iron complex transport system ATP-binding protein n=1 Tax=Soonwooa buanensis TaxID=619805 RepID=A0A1T5CFL0_9FLAO|nr:ABC transporter ATP-binding protein [Soonwooa buanensis]SKB58275.1 iron complex transport system ATP-binding protein [Soonwooa buanensis]